METVGNGTNIVAVEPPIHMFGMTSVTAAFTCSPQALHLVPTQDTVSEFALALDTEDGETILFAPAVDARNIDSRPHVRYGSDLRQGGMENMLSRRFPKF